MEAWPKHWQQLRRSFYRYHKHVSIELFDPRFKWIIFRYLDQYHVGEWDAARPQQLRVHGQFHAYIEAKRYYTKLKNRPPK